MIQPESIEFITKGSICRGKLFRSPTPSNQVVLITGAIGMVQEQAPLQYAGRLAQLGIHAVTFDHRFFGISDGSPRQLEHPERKSEDIEALADFLKSSGVLGDSIRVIVLGICKGGAYALRAAARSPDIEGFIGVSGFYFDAVSLEAASGYQAQRIAQGKLALETYESTGAVDYLPIVHATRQDAALPYPALHAWYSPWETTSHWQNRYAVMSDYFIYQYLSAPDAGALEKPTLIIHGRKSTNPDAAGAVFDAIPCRHKSWQFYEDGVDFQTNFYDRAELIDRACGDVCEWLDRAKNA